LAAEEFQETLSFEVRLNRRPIILITSIARSEATSSGPKSAFGNAR
jgi:hypothetical protein